jgi:hypothetical protein
VYIQLGDWPEFEPVNCTAAAAGFKRAPAQSGPFNGFTPIEHAIAADFVDSDVDGFAASAGEYSYRRGFDSLRAATSRRA